MQNLFKTKNLLSSNRLYLSLFIALACPLLGHADLTANEVSHLLAGSSKVESPSPLFEKIVLSKEWKSRLNTSLKYRFDPPDNFPAQTRVTKADRESLKKFAAQNLAPAYEVTQTLFYPFGGPDAFYPLIFFPNSKRVIIAALEPASQLLKIRDESDLSLLYRGMDNLSTAFRSYFQYGYFITGEMTSQLSSALGTSTVICASLAAQGFQISSMAQVSINPEGTLTYADESKEAGLKANGVEIKYVKNDANKTQASFVYFRQDLSNSGVAGAFEKFIVNEKPDSTYYKAASYVPHETGPFSKVNALALRSKYIVQGDSGLPWSLIKSNSEKVDLFGQYTKPSSQFGTSYQTSLMKSIGLAIETSKSPIAKDAATDFRNITGQSSSRLSSDQDESNVRWQGYLPIRYDYAGMLNSHGASDQTKNKYSLLIFATLKAN